MPIDLLPFSQKRSALGTSLAGNLAANTYSQFLAQQRGNRQLADTRQQFKVQTPKIMSAYLRRGLSGPGVQSGIYEKGLGEFAVQQATAENDIQQALNEAMDRLKQERGSFEANYQQQLADLESQKAAAIANAAATLAGFKPYLGG